MSLRNVLLPVLWLSHGTSLLSHLSPLPVHRLLLLLVTTTVFIPTALSHIFRWSESGSIACSYDRDRLFCSHNNGAIAAIYDTHQNGSVMDPQGRCLLGIQSNGVAVERGVTGNIVQTYRKDTEEAGESRWLFDGVEIEFDPRKWELKIVVSNARLRCQFTNLEGGKLLEGAHTYLFYVMSE